MVTQFFHWVLAPPNTTERCMNHLDMNGCSRGTCHARKMAPIPPISMAGAECAAGVLIFHSSQIT